MLADNIFERSIAPSVERFRRQEEGARILLSQIEDDEHLSHLGVAELDADGNVVRVVEKPDRPPAATP